jgi:hypothetical protein
VETKTEKELRKEGEGITNLSHMIEDRLLAACLLRLNRSTQER